MLDTDTNWLSYRAVLSRRTEAELDRLAVIKRFTEMLVGDPKFRDALIANHEAPGALAAEYGLDIELEGLRPLFDKRVSHHRFEQGDPERWPDVKLWDDFIADKLRHRDALRRLGETPSDNPRFNRWRARQINRCSSELGMHNDSIVHALSSFELSSGCSVGCWFCGISADKFQGAVPFDAENAALWRDVLEVMVDRFGAAAQSGFCYWATDPMDNPDYLRYLRMFHEVTGMLPQTTTAAPLRNVALTREVLALSAELDGTLNRFSILTVPILRRVFAEFSPRELLDVELVMQQKGALTGKSLAGRARDREAADSEETPTEAGTIACVTGFLVNMRERKVRLASPCRTTDRWPEGYRVYAEGRFADGAEFAALIDALIDEHMSEQLGSAEPARFRDDLRVTPTNEGFIAESPFRRQVYAHSRFGQGLAAMLQSGDRTVGEIVSSLGSDSGTPLDIHRELLKLQANGLLDDDPVNRRAAVPAAAL